jgi:hypothetical protein
MLASPEIPGIRSAAPPVHASAVIALGIDDGRIRVVVHGGALSAMGAGHAQREEENHENGLPDPRGHRSLLRTDHGATLLIVRAELRTKYL